MKENLKRKTNLIKEYLITQGILEESECIFKMDFFPDFEYTDFQKGRIQTYYFHEEISFSNDEMWIIKKLIKECSFLCQKNEEMVQF